MSETLHITSRGITNQTVEGTLKQLENAITQYLHLTRLSKKTDEPSDYSYMTNRRKVVTPTPIPGGLVGITLRKVGIDRGRGLYQVNYSHLDEVANLVDKSQANACESKFHTVQHDTALMLQLYRI